MQLIPNPRFIFFISMILCGAFPEGAHSSESIFKVRLSAQPRTLKWNSATSGSESAIILNLMEGLFETDRYQQPIPKLAQKSTWSQNGKILKIKIRKDRVWSDGKPLLAKHFVDGFENLLNPEVNSPHASLLFDVSMAKDYFMGKVKNFSQVGVKATQSHELTLMFQEPRTNFIPVLTHWATFPYRKDKPEVTLGPYLLNDLKPITLLKNPKYKHRTPLFSKVIFEVVPDAEQALSLYQSKKIDFLLQTETETHPGVDFAEPVRVVALLMFNPLRSKVSSPETRRAIMKTISLTPILAGFPGSRLPASQLIPILDPSPTPLNRSFPIGALPDDSLTLGYSNDDLSRSVAQAIQKSTRELKIKIEPLPTAQESAKKYDLILTFFGLDYAEPDQFFSAFLPQGSLDLFGTTNPEINDLIHQARLTSDREARNSRYREAADFLQNKAAIVMPLFYRRRAYLLSPNFTHETGFKGSPQMIKIHSKKE